MLFVSTVQDLGFTVFGLFSLKPRLGLRVAEISYAHPHQVRGTARD